MCQASHDPLGPVLFSAGIGICHGAAANEQSAVACKPEIFVKEIGVPDHERLCRKQAIDICTREAFGNREKRLRMVNLASG
jgi:hypothetical protein